MRLQDINIPSIAIIELNPEQLALYANYVRFCSTGLGTCTYDDSIMAGIARVSIQDVPKLRKQLEQVGYIKVTVKADWDREIVHEVRIVDKG
jgi:hypothetical protein